MTAKAFLSLRTLIATAMILLLPQLAAAQDTMSPEAFERHTTGKTLFYSLNGTEYGAEQYLQNRQVIWAYEDGSCQRGEWFVDQELICFVYEGTSEPQCWSFQMRGGRMMAMFENDPSQTTLYELHHRNAPLSCPGPYLGS